METNEGDGPVFKYRTVTSSQGLPPPSPSQLLHIHLSAIPFPHFFPDLYACLCTLRESDSQVDQLKDSELNLAEKFATAKSLGKLKVANIANKLSELLPMLSGVAIELIMPYIEELLSDPHTSVQATWILFNPISQALGPKGTIKRLLPWMTKLLDGENSTSKHMKLYHWSFLLHLIIRLGLGVFLSKFSTLLIEAVAGYKDFAIGDGDYLDSVMEEMALMGEGTEEVFFHTGGHHDEDAVSDNYVVDDTEAPPIGDKEDDDDFPDKISLGGGGEDKPRSDSDRTSSDSSSVGHTSLNRVADELLDTIEERARELGGVALDKGSDAGSIGSGCITEDMLNRSAGKASLHSVSGLCQAERTNVKDDGDGAGTSTAIGMLILGKAIRYQILYNWYFLQAFNFCYFRAPHDSTKITSFKGILCEIFSPSYLNGIQ